MDSHKYLPLMFASLLLLSGCYALHFNYIPIPELNPAECGCPDGGTRIKITITHGATLCQMPDMTFGGDVCPVCISNSSVKDTHCRIVENPPYYSQEKVECP